MRENPTVLELDATLDNLLPVQEGVSTAAHAVGYAEDQLLRIELVVEEAFLNVVHHAYHDRGGKVVVTCELTDHGLFQVTIIDHADPFDTSSTPSPGFDDVLDVRQPGGCGMTLIRSMTKSAAWQREADRNLLSMVFDPPAVAGRPV